MSGCLDLVPESLRKAVEGGGGTFVFGPCGPYALSFFDLAVSRDARPSWVVAHDGADSLRFGPSVHRISGERGAAWVAERLSPVEVAVLMAVEPETWGLCEASHEDAVSRLALQLSARRVRASRIVRAAEFGPVLARHRLAEVVEASRDG